MTRILFAVWLAAAAAVLPGLSGPGSAAAQETQTIRLASTTSVDNSGLLAAILPQFTKATGITVHVLAQGTGQALDTARRGDADLVLVHDPEAEQKFVGEGHGLKPRQIAWNDFIVVGPQADPAQDQGRQRRRRGVQGDRRGQGAVRLARRPQRHERAGIAAMEGRRARSEKRRRELVSRNRRRNGAGAQRGLGDAGLYPVRSRHLAQLQEQGAARRSSSKAIRS